MTTADRIGTWLVPQSQFAIAYSIAALGKINRAAVEALVALRGGLGIGGVLLGTRDPKGVRILAFRAVECEYAFGPVFALSEHDRHNLTELLRDLRQNPGLKGTEVVGWYVSHTRRGGRMLAESDLDIYQTFFPEPWQVTLVLQPTSMAPTVAGFFFRESDGSVRSSSTYREFSLGTWEGGESPEPATPNAPPDQPGSRPEAVRTEPLVLETRVAEEDYANGLRPISGPVAADAEEPPAEVPATASAPGSALPAPIGLQPSSESRAAASSTVQRTDRTFAAIVSAVPIWLWLAGVLVVAAAAGWTVMHWLPSPGVGPAALHLKCVERNGLLQIRWESAALAAQNVQAGAIDITDGLGKESFSLDPMQVMSGSVLYPRRSDTVEVNMTVKLRGGAMAQGYTNFNAADSKTAVTAKSDPQEQKELATEAERTQQELNKAEERNQQLEQALKTVREAQPGASLAVPSNRAGPGHGGAPAATVQAAVHTARPGPANSNAGAAGSRLQPAPVVKPPEEISSPLPGASRLAGPEAEKPAPSAAPVTSAAPAQVPRSQVQAQIVTPPAAQQVGHSAREGLAAEGALKVAQTHESSAPPPAPTAVQRALPQPQPLLAGRWDYSKSFQSGSPFPPESATLAIAQSNDQVTGTFTGRYRVPKGRKFKTDVQLRFAGPSHAGSQKFAFTAADGNTGEIEILTVSGKPNEVEVVWHSARDGLTFDDVLFRAQ